MKYNIFTVHWTIRSKWSKKWRILQPYTIIYGCTRWYTTVYGLLRACVFDLGTYISMIERLMVFSNIWLNNDLAKDKNCNETIILNDFYEWHMPKFHRESDTNCLAENDREKIVCSNLVDSFWANNQYFRRHGVKSEREN